MIRKLPFFLFAILTLMCSWQPEQLYLAITSKPTGEVVQVRDGRFHCIISASKLPEDAQVLSALPTFQSLGLYHDYRKVEEELRGLESRYPGRCSVYDIGDSVEGRDILAIRFQPSKPSPGILFVGAHHAREWMSVEIPMALANILADNPNRDPRIERWLSQYDIWIVPMLNPDGHQYSVTKERLWRKNRRPLVSAYGVDLNRNYSYKWSNMGASGNYSSDIYQGSDEFSEPETQAIRNLAQNIPFFGAITFHTYGNMILHSWGYGYDKAPFADRLDKIGKAMARLSGKNDDPKGGKSEYLYKVMESSRLYPASGDMCDYFYSTYGAPTYTYEMTDSIGGFVNEDKEIEPTVGLVIPMSLEFLDALPKEFCMVFGRVVDENGNPLSIDLYYKNIEFAIKTDPATGRFHHVLPKGQGYVRYKQNGKDIITKVDFEKDTNFLNLVINRGQTFDLTVDLIDRSKNPTKAIICLFDSNGSEIARTGNVTGHTFKSIAMGDYVIKAIGTDYTSQFKVKLVRNLSVSIEID